MSEYSTIALIVAAGRGTRLGSEIPKQYIKFNGLSALQRSIKLFKQVPSIDAILVVIHPEDTELYEQQVAEYDILPYVLGGKERQDSVRLGLEEIQKYNPQKVLIHDAARPFTDRQVLEKIIAELDSKKAVIAAYRAIDTIKLAENKHIVKTLDRSKIYQATTPQGFEFATIIKAHQNNPAFATDDAALCEQQGIDVFIVESNADNFKITTEQDLKRAIMLTTINYETRIGMGFDAHRFSESSATSIPICGVYIPSNYGIEAHSDGDVALHALVDAVLGAIAAGDIGVHFPPSDPEWKNVDSKKFVTYALELLKQKQGELVNIDITIIAEAPRIGPYREEMRKKLAEITSLAIDRISIKATTTEKMGFTGRKEGLAAQAIVNVKLPY